MAIRFIPTRKKKVHSKIIRQRFFLATRADARPALSVHIPNTAIASGRSEGYLATATLHLEVPTRFAGRVLPPVSLNLQVQAKYIPKF